MPDDEDRGLLEDLGELAEEAIYVDTLMGWDGDPCRCDECSCPRFRDETRDARCARCRTGDHSPG